MWVVENENRKTNLYFCFIIRCNYNEPSRSIKRLKQIKLKNVRLHLRAFVQAAQIRSRAGQKTMMRFSTQSTSSNCLSKSRKVPPLNYLKLNSVAYFAMTTVIWANNQFFRIFTTKFVLTSEPKLWFLCKLCSTSIFVKRFFFLVNHMKNY